MRYSGKLLTLTALVLVVTSPRMVYACGGFFCDFQPISQAGEQIVFRQDGNQITAMVQIQYVGNAEDFGWVVPVPSTPEASIGSNLVFSDLEQATRPQFNLSRTGQACEVEFLASPTAESSGGDTATDADGGVTVESVEEVGNYIVTVISGTDPQAVANWLAENNLDLSDRGAELLAPYIEDGMKFVALKLQQNRDAGNIQPLILKYQSDKPVIPIRLTAVAAVEDMGVLVWLLGDARAVPENYLHVTPNYTRLNWYGFGNSSYVSYQGLITDAMDEAGGKGFATDYAGRFPNLADRLTSADSFLSTLNGLATLSNAEFIVAVQRNFNDGSIGSALSRTLPVVDGEAGAVYTDAVALSVNYTGVELSAARSELDRVIREDLIEPLRVSRDLLDDNKYLTRLYTTLSASEMTLDPSFVFNSDMGDQSLDRNATLDASCIEDQTQWTLTLGEGTGRNDVVVIDTVGVLPFATPAFVNDQEASWKIEDTAVSGQPIVRQQRSFQAASASGSGSAVSTGGGSVGLGLVMLLALRSRRSQRIFPG